MNDSDIRVADTNGAVRVRSSLKLSLRETLERSNLPLNAPLSPMGERNLNPKLGFSPTWLTLCLACSDLLQ